MARSKFEILTQKTLEKEGFFVDWKVKPRFPIKGYTVDYFHRFDLLAYKEGEPLRWIAVKGKHGNYQLLRKEIESFQMPEGNIKELWRHDRNPKDKREIRVKKEIIG